MESGMGRRGDSSAAGVGRQLGVDEVVDHFTLIGDEVDQLHNMSGATRLGFAVLLNFCGIRLRTTAAWATCHESNSRLVRG